MDDPDPGPAGVEEFRGTEIEAEQVPARVVVSVWVMVVDDNSVDERKISVDVSVHLLV